MKPSEPRPLPRNIRLIGDQHKGPIDQQKQKPPLPDPPDHFDEAARACWTETAGKLTDLGVLTEADHDLLELYVVTWLRWHRAIEQAGDEYTVKAQSGFPIQNPLLGVANKSLEHLLKIEAAFGLTPVSRGRNRTKW